VRPTFVGARGFASVDGANVLAVIVDTRFELPIWRWCTRSHWQEIAVGVDQLHF